ncbi:glycosyltransferase family 2 protein [Salinarimonas sp.]|uniref:glycosyltransferase family 2 protein n=1 Tax=Salinarimonas sp. TaxID=2766526 RepID=UPI0032D987E6
MQGTGDGAPEGGAAKGEGLPLDIAFLAGRGIASGDLRRAARRARETGEPAATALLANGWCAPETFYSALADEIGAAYLGRVAVAAGTRPVTALDVGMAPLEPCPGLPRFVAAPRGAAIAALLAQGRGAAGTLALTTPDALREAVFARCGPEIAKEAADGLARTAPHLSCRGGASRAQGAIALGVAVVALVAGLAVDGAFAWAALAASLVFLALSWLRLAACAIRVSTKPRRSPPRAPDSTLPTYTLLVPLRDEAKMARQLCDNILRLDYPREKLDIKLLVEADDPGTGAALRALRLPSCFEILTVPPGAPATKPRALNAALPLARDELTVVYDAEDAPEPDQLRLAAAAFAAAGPDLACLQARLSIRERADSTLTILFKLEYAALFDVVNPGLLALGLPIPLGGTSNHFRTAALRRLGGWDAWNVTEDADMGLRIAALGMRTADLPSTTWEEAPPRLSVWLRQRSRWMKGYMQTMITHTRDPLGAARRLGLARLCATWLFVGGTVASALLFPLSLAALVVTMLGLPIAGLDLTPLEHVRDPVVLVAATLATTTFGFGFLGAVAVVVEGLRRRRRLDLLRLVPLLPVYFFGVSVGAWRGLFDLLHRPHHWHKTAHGLAPAPKRRRGARKGDARKGDAPGKMPAE